MFHFCAAETPRSFLYVLNEARAADDYKDKHSKVMFTSKPDPSAARKELNGNLVIFGLSIIVVRASTYLLELVSKGGSTQ